MTTAGIVDRMLVNAWKGIRSVLISAVGLTILWLLGDLFAAIWNFLMRLWD